MQSMSRFDEEFIRQRIESYLQLVDPTTAILPVEPGRDPPDCYVVSNGKKVPMEITRAEVEFMDGEKRHCNLSFINSLLELIAEISAKIDARGYDYFLDIHLVGPILDVRRFKKDLEKRIGAFMANSSLYAYDDLHFFEVAGEKVVISKICGTAKAQFLRGSIGEKDYVASSLIQDQTDTMYANLIKRKERIMAAIQSEKWLAIYNGYPLAEEHNIRATLAKLQKSHSFTRIFIVNMEGHVFEADEQSPNSACS